MGLLLVGASHHTAPIEVRERLAFGPSEAPAVLSDLAASGLASEAVALSTCNRTEIYAVVPDDGRGEEALRTILAARGPDGASATARYLYVHRGREAVEHLLRVTAGLDSMVVGEPQIQGQVRDAYQQAAGLSAGERPVVGPTLNRLFQQALGVGGRVRSETGLGIGAASVSTAAVELAKKIFGSLQERRALVLGAGEMSEVTLECLRAEGVRTTLVANRTYARAAELADRWSGSAVPWEELGSALPGVDIVVCSTAAPHPVLTRERVRESFPGGAATRPLCIIDIAIPRDVDPRVGDEPNIFLYNIDDLQQVVHENLGRRQSELPKAHEIVAQGVEEFWSWQASLAVVPTIRELREHGETVRQAELERALRRLEHLPPEDREAVEQMTRAMLNKLLHEPTVRLRAAAGNGKGRTMLEAARFLFGLDDGVPSPKSQVPSETVPSETVPSETVPSAQGPVPGEAVPSAQGPVPGGGEAGSPEE